MPSRSSASTDHQLHLQKKDKQMLMQMPAGSCGDVDVGEWSSEQQGGVGRSVEDRVRVVTRLE